MDADLFAQSVEYEQLAQAVYQAILRKEGDDRIEVQHDSDIEGRSGVKHQVDVTWSFRKAGINHRVLVECKNYGTAISLEKVRNFFAVIHDIGHGCAGVMITKTGYQSGVVEFAEYYHIGLKLLRKPTPEDWEGRIKDIRGNLHLVGLATSPEKCPKVEILSAAEDPEELKAALASGDVVQPPLPETQFVNAEGIPLTEQLCWWLPKKLAEDKQSVGGPYTKTIALEEHYMEMPDKNKGVRRVKVIGLKVTYFYEIMDTREIIIAGDQVVDAILRDFSSGEVEHFHHKNSK